jgi:hypothetical protein
MGRLGEYWEMNPPALFVRQRIVRLLVVSLHTGKQKGFRSSPVPADII